MKIAISAQGKDMNSQLDPRFGRAAGFMLVDLATQDHEFVPNGQNLELPQGAGIQSAMRVSEVGAKAVITGHVGPKAYMALNKGGIAVYLRDGGTVREALEAYKAGLLQQAAGADKQGHW